MTDNHLTVIGTPSNSRGYAAAVQVQTHDPSTLSREANIRKHGVFKTPQQLEADLLHSRVKEVENRLKADLKPLAEAAGLTGDAVPTNHSDITATWITTNRPSDPGKAKTFDQQIENFIKNQTEHKELAEAHEHHLTHVLGVVPAVRDENPLETHARGFGGWIEEKWNAGKDADGNVPMISWGKTQVVGTFAAITAAILGTFGLVSSAVNGGNQRSTAADGGQTVSIDDARKLAMMAYQKGLQAQGPKTIDTTAQPA